MGRGRLHPTDHVRLGRIGARLRRRPRQGVIGLDSLALRSRFCEFAAAAFSLPAVRPVPINGPL